MPHPDGQEFSNQLSICVLQILCKLKRASFLQPRTCRIFGCPKVIQFWICMINYVRKINLQFDFKLSFVTIISLGLHNMIGQHCSSDIVNATHNIIGLGIKSITTYPIDSSHSLQMNLIAFRLHFRHFIRSVVESKINAHLAKHGPNPDLFTALRSSMALELSIWTVVHDNNHTSPQIPTWSDYTYVDPV